MQNILILGAHGKIAQLATKLFLDQTDAHLTLFLRNAKRLTADDPKRETIIEGDADNVADLTQAMADKDVVYANLAGHNIEAQAKAVVAAMRTAQVKRLIWISTLGIYDEVPGAFGQWNHRMLDGGYLETYGAAAKVLEAADDLDYTIVRPAWLTNNDEIDYETTQKGDAFKGTEVSRKSIAAYVVTLAQDPTAEVHHSVGVNKPNTDGDKPAWY